MSDTGSIQIAFVVYEYLCLVDEPPESVGVNDSIAIALELGAIGRRGFRMTTTPRFLVMGRVGSQSVAAF
jgi:hypothetical protein